MLLILFPDHEPLHDLSAHLTLWMENAAAGRYTSFFSHILVNRFCEVSICYFDLIVGIDDDDYCTMLTTMKTKMTTMNYKS